MTTLAPELPVNDDPAYELPTSQEQTEAEYRRLVSNIALNIPVRQSTVSRVLMETGRMPFQLGVDVNKVLARLAAIETLQESEPDLAAQKEELARARTASDEIQRTAEVKLAKLAKRMEEMRTSMAKEEREFRQRQNKAFAVLYGEGQSGSQTNREAIFRAPEQTKQQLQSLQQRRFDMLKKNVWSVNLEGARRAIESIEFAVANHKNNGSEMPEKWNIQVAKHREIVRTAEAALAQAEIDAATEWQLIAQYEKEYAAVYDAANFPLDQEQPKARAS